MENEYEKTDNVSDNIIEIAIHYKLKTDSMIYRITLSPYDYYWNLTEEIVADHYQNAVERYSDYRDYIVAHTGHLHEEVEFLIADVKNLFTKESTSYFSFFFDDKSITFTQTNPLDVMLKFSVIYSMKTDKCYDIARIDVTSNLPTSVCYANILISRLMALNSNDNVLIDSSTRINGIF